MDTRRLLSSSALYGLADVIVLAVGGFLLLPLYTRTLSQTEFGHYVAVRANIDLLTYALHLGIPSAVARLYFDHRKAGTEHAYLSSVVWLFLGVLAVLSLGAAAWGESVWRTLSPAVPLWPALPLCLAISATGFLSALSVVWLRSEGKVLRVVGLQLSAAVVLAATAAVALLVLRMQLEGVLLALLLSAVVPAVAFPLMLGRRFHWRPQRAHVVQTLHFALHVLVGYLAYFMLNRFSTVLLQRHVQAAELGVFGLAQQLSMIVSMACTSFGAALQPMIFGAATDHVNESLRKAGQVLMLLMMAVSTALLLFAADLLRLVAPHGYAHGQAALTVMAVSNFTLAFTLISETALLYHHKAKTSVAISVASAVVSSGLALWLIPEHHALGAAASVAGGFGFRMLFSQWAAWRLTGQSRFGWALGGVAAVALLGLAALELQALDVAATTLFGIKALVLLAVLALLFFFQRKF